ncbi:MAG TPA: hypothetical protein VGB73_07910 [Pyrinomonadaceae bacterium]|jgi:hypothetical protein
MPEKKNENKPKRRTQVKELPKKEKALTKDEQKKVKGGYIEEDPIRVKL